MPDKPIAEWLRETRRRQAMPSGDPWTQEYFLERLRSETGWAPHRPNYSKYENGKATPERETLAKFIAFWTAHGEPGPDLTPSAPPADPIDLQVQLIASLRNQTAALDAIPDLVDVVRQLVTHDVRQDVVPTSSERDRRRYWIAKAAIQANVNAEALTRALGQNTTFTKTVRPWLNGEGDVPDAWWDRLAPALNLPVRIIRNPPPTDDDRLAVYRREAMGLASSPETEAPDRQARRRTA